jgi:acetyl-CoA carboxylase biotin carboxyl carrier protein
MRVEEIKRLIELVEESRIDELEVRRWWSTVRIAKLRRSDGRVVSEVIGASAPSAVAPAESRPETPPAVPAEEPQDDLVPIASPMVGTFYTAPAPSSPAYVEIGSRVAVGQVVCIIEAMKLMNEIESEVAGTVAKIMVHNEQPVEFNQPLFLVKPDA